MAYITPPTRVTGTLITASIWNQDIVANEQASAPDVFTTKGDLFVATAADTGARLAAGVNGNILVSDSTQTSGLRWSSATITAASGFARLVDITGTMTAAANADQLQAFRIAPTYAKSTFTGLTAYGVNANGAAWTASGTGTIDIAIAVYSAAPTIGTANYAFYAQSGQSLFIGDVLMKDNYYKVTSTGLAHGVTDFADTDVAYQVKTLTAAVGGALLESFSETTITDSTFYVIATQTDNPATTKGITSKGVIRFNAVKKSGTGRTNFTVGGDYNIFSIETNGNTSLVVDSDGDIFGMGQVFARSNDTGGVAGFTALTGISDTSANSTGVGTIKFKGATSRDSTGFIKFYVGTTAYYVPIFSAITG